MHRPIVITIDGPAGAGKSTLGELLAQRLGFVYFDTGATWRTLTLLALRHGIDPDDAAQLEMLAHEMNTEVLPPTVRDGRHYTVLLDGEDVTWKLRTPEIERSISHVARHPNVRREVARLQRAIVQRSNSVVVGRAGHEIAPDSPLKIYLDASLDIRAQRRLEDFLAQGRTATLEESRSEIARRDDLDSHLMHPLPDSVIMSTDTHSPDQIVELVLRRVEALMQPDSPVSSS